MFRGLFLAAALALPGSLVAQAPSGFMPDGISYDPEIMTPEEAFGHELGAQATRYDQIVSYFRTMAEVSDRIAIQTIGRSVEGRPIEFLTVTAPENHTRLEDIRSANLALASAESDPETIEDMPVITWLGFGIHGAEAAGLEAAVPLVYHLAAGEGDEIERILRDSVILILAAMNPDGHARRIDHSLSFLSHTVVHNSDHAGHDLWTSQRANHYGFDLNRQWLLVNQHEAQVWVPKWHEWKPHFSGDFHEMGTTSVRPSTYYFSPGDRIRTNPLIPDQLRPIQKEISRYHIDALDSRGTLYFTEEVYNSFYIGSASSYPELYGSAGSLFEVGTAHLVEMDTPLGRWSLSENIAVHFTTALTSIAAAADLRPELLAYRQNFYAQTRSEAQAHSQAAYVFSSPDKSRLANFLDLLATHQIAVHELGRDIRLDGVDYRAGDAYVVAVDQDAYRMIRSIFDRVTSFQDPAFADVTGWTLALTYNLDHSPVARDDFNAGFQGSPASANHPTANQPDRASYAYAFSWVDHYAPRALYRLQQAGAMTRVVMTPVSLATTAGEVELGHGGIVVPLKGQTLSADQVYNLVADIARNDGIEIHALNTGNTLNDGADLGSGRAFGTLRKPSVLLLFDDGIQRFDMGHLWHLLDVHMEMPVTLKQKDRIEEIDWSRYTHIILPGGRDVGLSDAATQRVRHWIRDGGGTFIGIRQGAEWAQGALLGRQPLTERTLEGVPGLRFNFEELRLRQAEDVVSGAIFASDLDITHPLGYGYHRRMLPSHRDTSIRLVTPEDPVATVARYHESPLLGGYASERRQREIGGSPMLTAERVGNGGVVLMTDNPTFRGAYFGTNKLLLNSLFFSDLIASPSAPGGARFRP